MSSVVEGFATAAGRRAQSAASSALTGVSIVGSIIGVILLYAPLCTMVIPVWKEGSVGDRMIYAHLLAFFNSVMWTLYASTDLPSSVLFFIISGMGIVVHFFYISFYIYFADGKKSVQALRLSFAFCVAAFIMAELVASMVLITHRWSSTFVHVLAALSGASTQIVPTYDLVMIVMNCREINNINPIITAVISLLSACTWTPYGFMSVPMNPYVVVPNLMGILSAVAQIIVYSCLIYRKTGSNSNQTDAVEKIGKLEVELPVSPV